MIIKTAAWAESGTIYRLYATKSISKNAQDSREYLAKGKASFAKSHLAMLEKELLCEGFKTSGVYR